MQTDTANARTIPTTTHGRYLVRAPAAAACNGLLVGFHGYAESAEAQLDRMCAIPGSDRWLIVSVQALHRFYRGRTEEVVAGWMTRQDREQAIADNIAYVKAVVDAVVKEHAPIRTLVFAGFSQGVAMAFRAAAAARHSISGVIACGGDVPPELDAASLGRIPAALVGRGLRDGWYTPEKLEADLQRLRAAGVDAAASEFDGGHDWSAGFLVTAGSFLERFR